jgi:DNA-binding response OmpR family regulator
VDKPTVLVVDGDDRVVDVHIRTLRKALRDDAANPAYIATIRSIGYRLIT